ncbi:hypothetical protein, partial [Thermococcus sp.]
MVGVTSTKSGIQLSVLDPREWVKRFFGLLPTTELIEESEPLVVDVKSVRELLNRFQKKLEEIPPEELLDKFLSVVPDTASEESYNEAIEKLERVYRELFPVEFGMLEEYRELSTPEVKKRVWEEVYKPIISNLAESFVGEGVKLWDEAFENELSDEEIERIDLINSWLFLLTKVFAISSRLDDMEKSVELSRFGFILYLRGVKVLNEEPVEDARRLLKQDFALIIKKILESGYEFQKADDHLLFEVLEDI